MKKIRVYHKALIIIIIGFLISLSASTSYGLTLKNKYLPDTFDLDGIILSGDVILVDDVPGWGPNNPPEDYTKIQDAINASHALDIIYVFGGVYNEKLVINKTIYLVGENKEKTNLNGDCTGDVVYISADYVFVCGFTIKNSGDWQPDDHQAGIEIASNSTTITNNIICNNLGNGIYFASSSFNNVSDNEIFENHLGVFFEYSNDNTVSSNIITNNEFGVSLYNSNNNTVKSNSISYNNIGIRTDNATRNNISENVISYNVRGLYLSYSSDNLISGNNFIKNKRRAALFRGYCKNQWIGNYWSRFRLLPKPIFGRMGKILGLIPWVNFDWSPARNPNNI